MLDIQNLTVHYGLIPAVKNINFKVKTGQITSLLGGNGAGKTSALLSIVSDVKIAKNTQIFFKDENISKLPTYKIIKKRISLVPEGRRVFINLNCDENLELGAFNNTANTTNLKDKMYDMFPRLQEKKHQLAGTMSGGEQQMLAIARALMSQPKLLMLDEPSLGLAPKIIDELFTTIENLKKDGITILLVEQNAYAALEISDYSYVLENGEITLHDVSSKLLKSDDVRRKYLGV
jgi:branched-chain amino acid transport system ATP-binding protein